jgi:DNA-binding ferritin-like protein
MKNFHQNKDSQRNKTTKLIDEIDDRINQLEKKSKLSKSFIAALEIKKVI